MSPDGGTTPSERYLAKLCRNSFLDLWSYPNPYRDQTAGVTHREGTELCDLLVACGNDVLLFSDKHCEMSDTGNILTDWKRWYRKTIMKSADQLIGAERWIRQHPGQIYIDPMRTQPLPFSLPSPSDMRIHRVIVANGARDRCKAHFAGGTGSLMLEGGSRVTTPPEQPEQPFLAQPPRPEKGFIHVLDEYSLDVLLRELDTITDLLAYLNKKRTMFTALPHVYVPGEEELLSYYLLNYDDTNGYHFPIPDDIDGLHLSEGFWADLTARPEYHDKKEADKISYLWDSIINEFSHHIMQGTLESCNASIEENERVLRIMAKERRLGRRVLAYALDDLAGTPLKGSYNSRRLISNINKDVGYVFVSMEGDRRLRREILQSYCVIFADEQPQLLEIVGIATEQGVTRQRRSHDLAYLDGREDRDRIAREASELRRTLGIGRADRAVHVHSTDFPRRDGSNSKTQSRTGQKANKKRRRGYKKRKRRSR